MPPTPRTHPPASTAPSFWHRLGSGIKDSASRVGQEIRNPGSTRGEAFRPLTPGANELVNLFPATQSAEAMAGHLSWPRVALTMEEYGEHLDCWTIRARVWPDATSHHDERFQICRNSPVKATNDLGQSGFAMPNDMEARLAEAAQTYPPTVTTGAVATEGPNPPMSLFMRSIPQPLVRAQWPVLTRLLHVTGFGTGIAGGGRDYRMWIAGYEPSGEIYGDTHGGSDGARKVEKVADFRVGITGHVFLNPFNELRGFARHVFHSP